MMRKRSCPKKVFFIKNRFFSLKNNWAVDRVFTAEMDEEKRKSLLRGWSKAVKCALMWGEES